MAKMTLDELSAQLSAAFGPELRAVVLYGSAAAGEHVPRKSDYNVLVLVDSLAAGRLQAASAAIHAWTEAGNAPPLTLTVDEWRTSSDIFPMEYADILERHRVLHGTLPTDVRVDAEHLRLELEHEAMGTLLQLRRGALAAGDDGKEKIRLLEGSLSTVMVIFRALLRLRGESPPAANVDLVHEVTRTIRADDTPFIRVIRHKRGEEVLRAADAASVLDSYLEGMQRVVKFLDQFRGHRA